jgi:hypothetical protein
MSKKTGYQEEWIEAVLKAHLVKSTMEDYELTFRKFLHTLRELEEGDFWQLQQVLMEDIFIFGLDPTIACIEFLYRPVDDPVDDSVPRYTDTDANRFVLSWQMKEARTKDFLRQQKLPEEWAYTIMMCNERVFNSLYHGEINSAEKFNFTCEDIAQNAYGNTARAAMFPDETRLSPEGEEQQIAALLKQGENLEISSRLETAARAAFTEAAQQEHGVEKHHGTTPRQETDTDGNAGGASG